MPERLRSSASIARSAPWASRRRARSASSSASAPSRIAPPAEARIGGSGAIVARRGGRGRRRPACRRGGIEAAEAPERRPPRRRRGRPSGRAAHAATSRGPAVPTAIRANRRSRSPTPSSAAWSPCRRSGRDELFDGVPPRLDLDRVRRRPREGVAKSPRAERRPGAVEERAEAPLRATPSDDSKSSSVAIAAASSPMRSPKRSGSGGPTWPAPRGRTSPRHRRAPPPRPRRSRRPFAGLARPAEPRRTTRRAAGSEARPRNGRGALRQQDFARPEEREGVAEAGRPGRPGEEAARREVEESRFPVRARRGAPAGRGGARQRRRRRGRATRRRERSRA